MSFWNAAWCRHWTKKLHSPLFISRFSSSHLFCLYWSVLACLNVWFQGGVSEQVLPRKRCEVCALWLLPSALRFWTRWPALKMVNSDVSRTHGGRLHHLGRTPEQFTLWLRTTILQENGLKVTLVATFFTIFKKLSAVLTALLLYPANLWIYRGSKFVLFWNYFIL